MKKNILSAFLFLIVIGTMQAKGQIIPLHILTTSYNDDRGHIRHAPPQIRLPVVEIDGNTVLIASLQSGNNFVMTLSDSDGNILYDVNCISTEKMIFRIPKLMDSCKYSIMIIVNKVTYIGEIGLLSDSV